MTAVVEKNDGIRDTEVPAAEFAPEAGPAPLPGRRLGPEFRRLAISLLLSLLVHLPLLGLTFGGGGEGLPGFNFPWQVRRVAVPDLLVELVPRRATEPEAMPVAEPMQRARAQPPVASAETSLPSVRPAAIAERSTVAIVPQAEEKADTVTAATPANAAVPVDRPVDVAPAPAPEPALMALARPETPTWTVPATPEVPAPLVAEAPGVSNPETVAPPQEAADAARARIDLEARERAVELARQDRERQEAQRQAEQKEAARQEAARQEAARKEAAQQETVRQEAMRQDAARKEAARQEAARQEAARREAARQESARQEAARQEAARQESARQESARQAAAREEASRIKARQEAEDRREAVRRALGRQLDEEAARREAAASGARLPLSLGNPRRGRLLGHTDPNAELVQYALALALKIQMNMTFEMVREAAKQPHTNPMVTVAVRSDGSVESVSFVVSSGVAALDEAIRRVVHSQEHYQAFPPGLAREYDVVEIRRTWHFDGAIRLH